MPNLELIKHKIHTFSPETVDDIKHASAQLSGKTVFTNGCFDLVHTGHVDYLSKAADLGEHLIVGLNSDNSVSRLKGPNRPVKDEMNRALVMASFFFVDMVVIFNEETPHDLIKTVGPHTLVKGGDYDPAIEDTGHAQYIVGRDLVQDTKVIPFVEGYSSTKLIEKSKR